MTAEEFAAEQARAFINDVWWPTIYNAKDGGIEIFRAVVAAIFLDAGSTDRLADTGLVSELMRLARQKADEGLGGSKEPSELSLESFDPLNPSHRRPDDPVRQALARVLADRS